VGGWVGGARTGFWTCFVNSFARGPMASGASSLSPPQCALPFAQILGPLGHYVSAAGPERVPQTHPPHSAGRVMAAHEL
jgi:hypothetical protein